MPADFEKIKRLREMTGAGLGDCRAALEASGGDLEKGKDHLRKKGQAIAEKKAGRETRQGTIGSYVHGGRVGVLVELNCESDFVARTEEFQAVLKDLCLQVASMSPLAVRREDVPAEMVAREKEIYAAQAAEQAKGKPPAVVEKIVTGRLEKFFRERCLLEQPYIRDDKVSVKDRIQAAVGKLQENLQVRRFVRFELGGE